MDANPIVIFKYVFRKKTLFFIEHELMLKILAFGLCYMCLEKS